VRTLVVLEKDYTAGRLSEAEIAFRAQDNEGNVWHMGEYPEEYEKGKFVDAPAWIAGLKGARAGIAMLAKPQLGDPSHRQGFAPAPISWHDHARVYKVGQRTCVPVDCYENVLVIEEFERPKPGAFQLKYYAPGVGKVRVGWRGAKEEERERLTLVDYRRLSRRPWRRCARRRWKWIGAPTSATRSTARRHRYSRSRGDKWYIRGGSE